MEEMRETYGEGEGPREDFNSIESDMVRGKCCGKLSPSYGVAKEKTTRLRDALNHSGEASLSA